jgi:phosphatidylinositol glycan class B
MKTITQSCGIGRPSCFGSVHTPHYGASLGVLGAGLHLEDGHQAGGDRGCPRFLQSYICCVSRRIAWLLIRRGMFCAGSTGLDYAITGRLYFPILTFAHQNLFSGLSAHYGATTPLYHLTQSLPIMLFPSWYWFSQGFVASLLPPRLVTQSLATLDRPACLRTLSRAVTFAIAVLSLSPHSEWRFLHPFLPALLIFALPPLFRSYTVIQGVGGLSTVFRQYIRISRRPFYLLLLAPFVPYLYLNICHGRAQVEVINALRRGDIGEVDSLVALMPCHSTPWMSHLHRDIPAWFLTCEPPIG